MRATADIDIKPAVTASALQKTRCPHCGQTFDVGIGAAAYVVADAKEENIDARDQ